MLREYEDVEAVILSSNSPLLCLVPVLPSHSRQIRGGEYQGGDGRHCQGSRVRGQLFCVSPSSIFITISSAQARQFDTMKSDGQFRKPASNKKLLDLMGGSSLHRLRRVHFWFVIDAQSDLNNGSSGYQCEMVRG
jgi:hypothetical protein